MGTCLGPGHDHRSIYVDLLEQIYSEAEQIQAAEQQSQINCRATGGYLYDQISGRLTKKSLFRKLTDHLSSHRNFINDCMQQNFRLMRQRKSLLARVTGLVVLDQLVMGIEQFSKTMIRPRSPSLIGHHSRPQPMVNGGIDLRFQMIYFQVVLELFDSEIRLRDKILESMVAFAATRQEKFDCGQLVSEMLEKLQDSLAKTNTNTELTAKCFAALLAKCNSNTSEPERSQEALHSFIKLWMTQQSDELRNSCERIVKQYIGRCLTSRQYGYIFQTIFQTYDQHRFQPNKTGEFETKLLQIIEGEELKDQFLKGMFKYLLTYLCVCNTEQIRERWELGIFEYSYQTVCRAYPNIIDPEAKRNAFTTLQRWIQHNYINIGELVAFNRSTLVYCFIFNFEQFQQQQQMLEWINRVLFEVLTRCDKNCLCMIFEMLVDEIYKTQPSTIRLGLLLVTTAEKCLKEFEFLDAASSDHYQNFLRALDCSLPWSIKNNILALNVLIVDGVVAPLPISMLDAICLTVYGFYDCLKYQKETIKEKYELARSMGQFFGILNEKGQQQLLIAFVQLLHENSKLPFMAPQIRYIQRNLALQAYSLISRTNQVPKEMMEINKFIIHEPDETKVQRQIEAYLYQNTVWPQPPQVIQGQLQNESERKRVELIKRYFDKLQSNGRQQDEEPQLMLRPSLRKRNSVTEGQSSRGDQSFQDIYGLIKESG